MRALRRAWPPLALGLAVAVVVVVGITIAGAQDDRTPRGTDPLSPTEEEVAVGLARGSGPTESAGGLGDDDVVLLVERHEEGKGVEDRRRADVYVYSYDDDVLTLTVVDTATAEVVSSTVLRDTQLPLAAEEGDRALDLALADDGFRTALATAYRQATGRDLADPATDLDIQPIVFRADANPAATPGEARVCGRHRCAQLLIQTTDDLLVDILPVVDLSAGRLLSATGFLS